MYGRLKLTCDDSANFNDAHSSAEQCFGRTPCMSTPTEWLSTMRFMCRSHLHAKLHPEWLDKGPQTRALLWHMRWHCH